MVPSFFFSPRNSGKLIWGVGPQVILPTATDNTLGQGKVSLGPTIVVLTQPKPWTIGVLVSNDWSIAGSGSRPSVNQVLMQPFLNYNLQKGWYLSTSPIITADWKASSGNVWVVPLGGGVGRVMKFSLSTSTCSFLAMPRIRQERRPGACGCRLPSCTPKCRSDSRRRLWRLRRDELPVLTQWPLSITVAMLLTIIGLVALWYVFPR
jgi:hypothetical protein